MGRDGNRHTTDLGLRKTRIFFQKGLDSRIHKLPDGQITPSKTQPASLLSVNDRLPGVFFARPVGQFAHHGSENLLRPNKVWTRTDPDVLLQFSVEAFGDFGKTEILDHPKTLVARYFGEFSRIEKAKPWLAQ